MASGFSSPRTLLCWCRVVLMCAPLLLAACGDADRMTAGDPAPSLRAEPSRSLRILVIGGTSGIGLETVKLALSRGHQVTAMARRPERLALKDDRLKAVQGDVTDAAAVLSAMAGQDAVVMAVGIGPTRKPVSVFSAGARNVLDAMGERDVRRQVLVTGIGAGESRGHGGFFYDRILQPLILKTNYEDKDRAETLVYESATDWTIVRPAHLTDAGSGMTYRVVRDMQDITVGKVARADVAHFIVAALENRRYLGETVLLTN